MSSNYAAAESEPPFFANGADEYIKDGVDASQLPMEFNEHRHEIIRVPHPTNLERPWTCRTCGAYFEYRDPELYTRECAWCDETFSCNRAHRKDMRPAYCLCIPCSNEHSRVYREKRGDVTTPEDYDSPTYWPFPEADSA